MAGQRMTDRTGSKVSIIALMLGASVALAGCEEGAEPLGFLKGDPAAEEGAAEAAAPEMRTVERDVEAPEIFSVEEPGLWDGRPSLGGVWVAHPSVKDPERVMIRNPANGNSVIGALFRRERDNPGPKLQVSSDAADELGLIAGAPTELSVVALRREEVVIEPPKPLVEDPVIASGEEIETKSLDEIAATAEGAIAAAETTAKPAPKPTDAKPAAPKPTGAAAVTPLPDAPKAPAGKMYAQLGIFSIEANAKNVVEQMSKAGIAASIRKEESRGKTFWRVVAGPAANAAERDALLKNVKGLGYSDAYAVSK